MPLARGNSLSQYQGKVIGTIADNPKDMELNDAALRKSLGKSSTQ